MLSPPPTIPILLIERCVHTCPPMKAPVPMPKLKMPEKMDMATDVDSCVVWLMISDCIEILNAVLTIPQRTSKPMTAAALSNVQKITSAENLRSRASDEIVPFREFIIKDDTSALL